MHMTRLKKTLLLFVCIVLIAAMALFAGGCSGSKTNAADPAPQTTVVAEDGSVLGEGAASFTFTVTDAEGKETTFQIHTDKETVGEALSELGLIAGEQGEYGLYVKTVNGLTVDYDKDGKYWAFYVDGEYASAGVDSTEITEGAVYAFKVE